jgi:hypothetical protein
VLASAMSASAVDRSISGTGNHPQIVQRGSAGTAFIRLGYPEDYIDGNGSTVITDAQRVNARTISNTLGAQDASIPNARSLSSYAWMWGQFLTHDLDLSSTSNGSAVNGTISIAVAPGDILAPGPITSTRTNFVAINGVRQQTNSITTWIDASQVYGSDASRAAALRTNGGTGAKLATSANNLPIYNTAGFANDNRGPAPAIQLFLAGDVRANENVALTALQTVFLREHNRLVDVISVQQPSLSEEARYQLARKIVGAEMQIVTYNEYLPAILGTNAPRPQDFAYSPQVDASITQSFAVAAFRFAHSMVPADMPRVNNDGTAEASMTFGQAFFNPNLVTNSPDVINEVLKGGATQIAEEVDLKFVDELRNTLFGPPGSGGTDLLALDIQRGRDHGLADYRQLRPAYGIPPANNFGQIPTTPELRSALQSLYANNINNLDAFVVGLAENHLPGSSLGPLFTNIIASQFQRLRDGDRLFYRANAADLYLNGVLRPEIASIIDLDRVRLADVIAWNTGLTSLQYQDDLFVALFPGDLNRDWLVDARDINLMLAAEAGSVALVDPGFDLNADGVVTPGVVTNASDSAHLVHNLLLTEFGDANLDRAVNFADLLTLAQNYQRPGGWALGNFDGLAGVNFADLLMLAQNYGFGTAESLDFNTDLAMAFSLVPEPATLALLVGASLLALRRR